MHRQLAEGLLAAAEKLCWQVTWQGQSPRHEHIGQASSKSRDYTYCYVAHELDCTHTTLHMGACWEPPSPRQSDVRPGSPVGVPLIHGRPAQRILCKCPRGRHRACQQQQRILKTSWPAKTSSPKTHRAQLRAGGRPSLLLGQPVNVGCRSTQMT